MKPFPLPTSSLALIAALVSSSTALAQSPEHPAAAREFVAALAREDFEGASAQFDVRMQAALPEAKLRALWRSLQAQAGPFRQMIDFREERNGALILIFVTCEFERTTLDAKVVFNRTGRISGLSFGPARKLAPAGPPPSSVTENDLTVGATEWPLTGTLSRPAAGQPATLPAVVLVHGSGPLDRDETVGANKPFRDLAWGLAAKGIAVLRYEKRSWVHAARLAALPTLTVKEEVVEDALAAVAHLRATAGIAGARIFVLGHSLGGMLAPRIARAEPRIAGLIVLAGPSRPLEDLMLEQTRYLLTLDGTMTLAEQAKLDELQGQVDRVKKLTPADASAAVSILGAPAAYWLDLRADVAPAAARLLNQPLLILQGGRDYQVTTVDFEAWQSELASSDRATLRLYPSLNHLFIAGKGPSTPAEYGQPGRVAQEVIDDIAAWILQH